MGRAPPSHPPQPHCSDRGASPRPRAGWQNHCRPLSLAVLAVGSSPRPLQDRLSAGPGPQNLFFPSKLSSAVLLPWKQELQSRHLPPHYPRHLTCPIFPCPPTPLPLLHPAPFSPGPQQTPVCSGLCVLAQTRGQPTFSVKGQIVNILGSADERVSVAATQLLCGRVKANMGLAVCVPVKLYL